MKQQISELHAYEAYQAPLKLPDYIIQVDRNGIAYAVFKDFEAAFEYDIVNGFDTFFGCSVASIGAFENAFCLGRLQ